MCRDTRQPIEYEVNVSHTKSQYSLVRDPCVCYSRCADARYRWMCDQVCSNKAYSLRGSHRPIIPPWPSAPRVSWGNAASLDQAWLVGGLWGRLVGGDPRASKAEVAKARPLGVASLGGLDAERAAAVGEGCEWCGQSIRMRRFMHLYASNRKAASTQWIREVAFQCPRRMRPHPPPHTM